MMLMQAQNEIGRLGLSLPLSVSEQKIITYLFENRISTQQQVRRDLFPLVSNQLVFRRLRKLEKLGIIKRYGLVGIRGKLINHYLLTKAGLNKFINNFKQLNTGFKIKSESPRHDAILTDIRNAFSKVKRVHSYLTENVLIAGENYHGYSRIPLFSELGSDAVIQYQAISGQMAWLPIELELSLKNQARCKEKLQRYALMHEVPLVLFIFENDSVRKKYEEIEKEALTERKPICFFSSLENVLSAKESITFANVLGDTLVLKNA